MSWNWALTIRLVSARPLAGSPKGLLSALSWSTAAPNTIWFQAICPKLGTIEADATRSVETIFLNAVARQQLGLDITIFGGVGLGYSSIDFDLRSLGGDTDFDVGRFSEDTIAFQGFVGFEKAITDDLGFVTQLGWFQADEPRLENELTQPFTMDVKSPSLSVGLRYEF